MCNKQKGVCIVVKSIGQVTDRSLVCIPELTRWKISVPFTKALNPNCSYKSLWISMSAKLQMCAFTLSLYGKHQRSHVAYDRRGLLVFPRPSCSHLLSAQRWGSGNQWHCAHVLLIFVVCYCVASFWNAAWQLAHIATERALCSKGPCQLYLTKWYVIHFSNYHLAECSVEHDPHLDRVWV